jgi:PAT family beta-lactamase induction signal transducer AmpG
VIALTVGGIFGGIAISKDGLGKWMLPMFFSHALNYWFCVAFSLPSFIVYYVYATVIAEQFGWFWFCCLHM